MKKYEYVRKTFTYDGVRHEVRGKTKKEAEEKMFALRMELERTGGSLLDKKTTVNELFEEWYALYIKPAKMSETRKKIIRRYYEIHIKPYIANKQIIKIKSTDLQAVMNNRQGMSKSYYSSISQILCGMFKRANIDRRIPFDPSAGIVLPESVNGSHRSITEEERTWILSLTGRIGTICRIMLYAGLRPGEVCALQWQDIDFEKNEIHVYKAYNKDNPEEVKGPKSKAGIRDIPMLPQLRAYLMPMQKFPFAYVVEEKNGKMMKPQNVTMEFQRLSQLENQADDLTMYCLRHTFATDLQKADVPINVAKELLGHSNIAMTANIYTHKDQSTLHKNMLKMSTVGKTVAKDE